MEPPRSPLPPLALAALLAVLAATQAALLLLDSLGPPPGRPPLEPLVPDLNSSPERHLMLLPGVGPARAAAIREAGPYSSEEELLDLPGIGPRTVEGLRGRVTAGGRAPRAPAGRPPDPTPIGSTGGGR